MSVTFSYVDDVARNISGYHENGVLVPSDVESFPLADRVELRSIVPSNYLPERVVFVPSLLDVLFPNPIGFCLELDVIVPYWFRQSHQILVTQIRDLIYIELVPVRDGHIDRLCDRRWVLSDR